MRVERPGEQLARILESATDPVQLMMSALGLRCGSDADLHMLDKDLASVVEYNTPANHLKSLFKAYNNVPSPADFTMAGRRCRFPTPLHFSSHYGLVELTKNLLKCDGAISCLGIINSEGNTPKNIAQNAGFNDIALAIEDAEVYSSVDDIDYPYLPMDRIKLPPAAATSGSVPLLPNTPPPCIHRSQSGGIVGGLQSISEDFNQTDIRDSGYGERESYGSAGSGDGTYHGSSTDEGSGDGEFRKGRGKKITRGHPVSGIGRGEVFHGCEKTPVSLGRNTSRRPSLPNVFMPALDIGQNESPPPPMCPGPTYQNIGSKAPPPIPRKKNSLPAVLDMNELQNNHVFLKHRDSGTDQ